MAYLFDFAQLRRGLFQSVTLGGTSASLLPLVNVDVSHKAFPKPYNSLIELLHDMDGEYSKPNRRFVGDLTQPLSRDAANKLHDHLFGLELCYCSDRTNKRIYKYFQLGKAPADEKFESEVNGVKIIKSVQQYFDNDLNCRPIRFPNLQCIRLGNKNRFISVPMEYCAIFGTQVSVNGMLLEIKKKKQQKTFFYEK